MQNAIRALPDGSNGDTPIVADFDGDGVSDIGFYRNGLWGVLKSQQGFSLSSAQFFSWGGTGLPPIVADFDGDGKADIAYVAPPAGGQSAVYSILKSSTGYSFLPGDVLYVPAGFPSLGDTPVVGDYDGDGKADPGIWRSSQGVWIIPLSSSNYSTYQFGQWGQSGDKALPSRLNEYLTPRRPATPAAVPRDGLANVSYEQATNRINTAGWQYDAAGNQTRVQRADGTWQRYVYDAAGRLAKVQNDSSVTQIVNTYGASNHRLVEQVGESSNQRTYYAWVGDSVIAEYEETPSAPTTPRWVKSYVYLGARLLATIAPSGQSERVEYHHPDRLGTRLVTNNQDMTSFEQVTLPFGTALDAESSGSTKRRFTSYDRSTVTGLDYAVNRHYDPLQGRFTQVDPIGMRSTSLANPQTLNLYAYCANDPINHTDPSGLGFFSFLGRIFGAIGKALHFVAKVLAVAAAVMVVVSLAIGLPGGYAVAFAVMSGILFASAYGPPIVGKLLNAVGGAAIRSRASVVAGTPPIKPNGTPGIGPISGFLAGGQIRIPQVNWLSLLLKVSVNFSVPRSQRSPQGELRECGTFTARITLRAAGRGHLPAGLIVDSIQPGKNHYANGFRQIGQGSYQRDGNRLVYTGTFQVGNILSGGVTANPGIKINVGLPGGDTSGDAIRLGVIDVAKSQEGAQDSYLAMRDTMPSADSKDPFAKCP